jgi:hypothetical protein
VSAALLRSLPRLRWRPRPRDPLVGLELARASPNLAPDFEILERELLPDFFRLDEAALQAQNTFRLGQLFVIVGGATATALGAVQAALGGGVLPLGIVGALVAGALAGALTYVRGSETQREYLTARLQAERLRSEYFLFLGRVPPYETGEDDDRLGRLREQVAAITSEDPR